MLLFLLPEFSVDVLLSFTVFRVLLVELEYKYRCIIHLAFINLASNNNSISCKYS